MITTHDWQPYSDAEIKNAERCSKCGLCRNTITSGPDDPCFGRVRTRVDADAARCLLDEVEPVCHCGVSKAQHAREDHAFVAMPLPPDAASPTVQALAYTVVEVAKERDAMHALLTDVMQSLRWTTEGDAIRDPRYEAKVEAVCDGEAYGALMAAAQRCWRRTLARRGEFVGGEHVAGPARATVDRWLQTWNAIEESRKEASV